MQKVLIAGCGYLGLATARLFLARGWQVAGLARSPQEAGEFPLFAGDLADTASLTALPDCEVVIHCASSGRGGADAYQRVYLDGMRHLAARFPSAHLIFTSSTSVYAQNDGSIIDETSAAEPTRETGQILRAAEDVTLAAGGCVARLAGIYGPGRSILLQRFFSGEAVIEDDGARTVNQIHRDDAASALLCLAGQKATGIFNVCDDDPLTQREVYIWLAEHFQRPIPPTGPVNPNRKRGVTNKRVSNAKLRTLGWSPQFPSFREAVAHDASALLMPEPSPTH